MSALVVDASVVVKWFLPEIHSQAAGRILKSKREFLAPDLIWAEVTNTLWKKQLKRELSLEEASSILKDFLRFPIQTFSSRSLLDTAWVLSCQLDLSVYDGLYLALAVGHGCPLVTADRKFYELLQKESVGSKLIWVEDVK